MRVASEANAMTTFTTPSIAAAPMSPSWYEALYAILRHLTTACRRASASTRIGR